MKTVDFSETIAACDLKVCRFRQLIKLMEVCGYSRSISFHHHGTGSYKLLFSVITGLFSIKFCMQAFRYKGMEIYQHNAGHMTNMAATTIYGIIPSVFSPKQWTDSRHETWYVASGTPAHHILFKL